MSDAHWTEVYELWTHIDSDQTIDVRDVWPEFADAMDRVVDFCMNGAPPLSPVALNGDES